MGTCFRRSCVGIVLTLTLFYVYIYRLSISNFVKYPFVYETHYPLIADQSLNLDNATYRQSYIRNITSLFQGLQSPSINTTETKRNTTTGTNFNTTEKFVPLLTLFTTWPEDRKYTVRNNTIRNWAHFKPLIQPVFFATNRSEDASVSSMGWDVLKVPKSSLGVPILKYMFLEVISKYKSLFYGFANGDILFDGGLVETLIAIAHEGAPENNPFLIIGRRTNIANMTYFAAKDVVNLSKLAKKKGELFRSDAEDYFITDSTFPWQDIPGVVIGRMAYDNWLVMHSRKLKHNVIDATETVLAVHQTTKEGNFEGSTHKHTDFNTGLLSRLYKNTIRYGAGVTDCAPYLTKRKGTSITLGRRSHLHRICYIP